MKRSEMINVLKQELDNYDAPGSSEDHQRLAEHILYVIELFDMMPPLVSYSSPELDDSYHWEPEDEA